eukprot:jgi/Botrbrau1/2171/Bobra.101_2s0011.1
MPIVWDVRILIISAFLAVSSSSGAFQEGRKMMQLISQTSIISLGGSLCTQGLNVAGSMRVDCISLDGKIIQIACLKMCQATEDSCAPCDDTNDVCRRATGNYNPEINFSVTGRGLYQDSGCQIMGGGAVRQAQALAPSPAQLNVTSILDDLAGSGNLNTSSARSQVLAP